MISFRRNCLKCALLYPNLKNYHISLLSTDWQLSPPLSSVGQHVNWFFYSRSSPSDELTDNCTETLDRKTTNKPLTYFVCSGKGCNQHSFLGQMTLAVVFIGIYRLQLRLTVVETRHPGGDANVRPFSHAMLWGALKSRLLPCKYCFKQLSDIVQSALSLKESEVKYIKK